MAPISTVRATTHSWGTTPRERELEFDCDRFVADPADALFRAVTVHSPPALLFTWLCQLRVAPYSYDWIDNLGRHSPRELTPGLDQLEVGQPIMTVFRLASFKPGRHITAVLKRSAPLFRGLAVTYMVLAEGRERSRLVAKIAVAYPRNPLGTAARLLLPPGDLVMMRKQLLTFKELAERDAARSSSPDEIDPGNSRSRQSARDRRAESPRRRG